MFNGFVNIENNYIDIENLPKETSAVFYSAEDKIPIEKHVGYKGPCVLYLVRKFYCKEKMSVHLILGYSSPYKVYFNGKPIAWGDESVCWMPLNNVVELQLEKGENTLVYKVARLNGEFEFSAIMSRIEFGSGVLVDIDNKL